MKFMNPVNLNNESGNYLDLSVKSDENDGESYLADDYEEDETHCLTLNQSEVNL